MREEKSGKAGGKGVKCTAQMNENINPDLSLLSVNPLSLSRRVRLTKCTDTFPKLRVKL